MKDIVNEITYAEIEKINKDVLASSLLVLVP